MNLYDGCMYYNRSLLRLQEWLKLGTAFTENYQKNTQKLCFDDICRTGDLNGYGFENIITNVETKDHRSLLFCS
jgi:hypothetical protein